MECDLMLPSARHDHGCTKVASEPTSNNSRRAMRMHAVMCRSTACTRRVGASTISYSTWLLWTAANVATGLYAWVDLKDWTLAGVNAANAACCGTVAASMDARDSDGDLITIGDRTFPEKARAVEETWVLEDALAHERRAIVVYGANGLAAADDHSALRLTLRPGGRHNPSV
jgi:hypothetical protein